MGSASILGGVEGGVAGSWGWGAPRGGAARRAGPEGWRLGLPRPAELGVGG